jgi:hypothetical protein
VRFEATLTPYPTKLFYRLWTCAGAFELFRIETSRLIVFRRFFMKQPTTGALTRQLDSRSFCFIVARGEVLY